MIETPIDATLIERGELYGCFTNHASISQGLKKVMKNTTNWHTKLSPSQRECLEMVAHKLGRILNGDPNYVDSWHDIIGYVRLVEVELLMKQRKENEQHTRSV